MPVKQIKDKYYLRSIHEEISLYDRKLAHLLKYDSFASDKARDQAAGKLSSKRDLLVRDARQLAEAGIEHKLSELPRSLRTTEQIAAEDSVGPAEEAQLPNQFHSQAAELTQRGTVLYFRKEVEEYMRGRRRTPSPDTAASHQG